MSLSATWFPWESTLAYNINKCCNCLRTFTVQCRAHVYTVQIQGKCFHGFIYRLFDFHSTKQIGMSTILILYCNCLCTIEQKMEISIRVRDIFLSAFVQIHIHQGTGDGCLLALFQGAYSCPFVVQISIKYFRFDRRIIQ